GRHDYEIRVPLHTRHPGGVSQRGAHVRRRIADPRRPLTDKNFRTRARATIVIVRVRRHLVLGAPIVMLVDDVRDTARDSARRDDFELWILFPDRVEELREAAIVTTRLAIEL